MWLVHIKSFTVNKFDNLLIIFHSSLQEYTYEILQEFNETADEEIRAFCQMVARWEVFFVISQMF